MDYEYCLDRLMKLDKEIEESERAVVHMNKQIGQKLQKIGKLKEERQIVSDAYKEAVSE